MDRKYLPGKVTFHDISMVTHPTDPVAQLRRKVMDDRKIYELWWNDELVVLHACAYRLGREPDDEVWIAGHIVRRQNGTVASEMVVRKGWTGSRNTPSWAQEWQYHRPTGIQGESFEEWLADWKEENPERRLTRLGSMVDRLIATFEFAPRAPVKHPCPRETHNNAQDGIKILDRFNELFPEVD